jgi:hypothetical protein
MPMDERKRRRAANEVVFRNINEWIEDLTRGATVVSDRTIDVVCECDDVTCGEQFPIAVETYERVRSDGTLFLVLPGHDDDSIETIVERADRYWVVRKDPGPPADLALATDPRDD